MQNIYANFNIFQLLDTSLLLYSTIFENISLEISSIFFIESINLLNLTINIENCQFSEILGNFPIFFRLDYQNIKISTTYFAYNEAGNFFSFNKYHKKLKIETIIYSDGVSSTIILIGLIFFRNNVNSENILIKNAKKTILKNLEFRKNNNQYFNFTGGCVGIYDSNYLFLLNVNVFESYSNMTTMGIKIIDKNNNLQQQQETSKFQVF